MKKTPSRLGSVALCLLFLSLLCISAPVRAQEQGIENLRQTGQAFRAVAKKVSPAVVFIKVEKTTEGKMSPHEFPFPFDDEFFRRFFGTPPEGRGPRPAPKHHVQGQGSGFIISSDGLILTNHHVVGDADKVTVRVEDGREFEAEVVGTDAPADVALIRIDAKDLPFLEPGDSDQLQVGDWVLAVGNPFGLSHTLTAGIVSAKGRSGMGINDYENFIQTDAAINPGNSGGPLVDLDGKVVGMNTAIFSRSGGYMGIGFAIPINMVQQIRQQLETHGSVVRGHLGVYIQELTPDLAESFGLKDTKGILVSRVMDDSPAAKAGLRQGDILVKMDGQLVGELNQFRNRIAMTAPGTVVKLEILREGKSKDLKVTIGKREASNEESGETVGTVVGLGLRLQPLTDDLASEFGYEGEKGALVAEVEDGSAADQAGIRPGDLIQEVGRQPVTSPAEVNKALEKLEGKTVLLLVRHGKGARYVTVKTK